VGDKGEGAGYANSAKAIKAKVAVMYVATAKRLVWESADQKQSPAMTQRA
jgi:hypothetical protein